MIIWHKEYTIQHDKKHFKRAAKHFPCRHQVTSKRLLANQRSKFANATLYWYISIYLICGAEDVIRTLLIQPEGMFVQLKRSIIKLIKYLKHEIILDFFTYYMGYTQP